MLKITKTAFLAGALISFGLMGSNAAQAADGETVYNFYCAQCHGDDGKGDGPNAAALATSPRNFTKTDDMNKLTDKDIVNVVMDGGVSVSKSALMPPWSKTITQDEVSAMVKHIRKLCNCKGKPG